MVVWAKAHLRLVLLLAAAAVVALVAFFGDRAAAPRRVDVAAPAPRGAPAPAAGDKAPGAPKVDLERLAQRTAKAPERNLFDSRDWRPPAPKVAPRPVEPQEEPLPPVPYTYLGRWAEAKGGEVVVLGRDGRSYLARVNDVLDAEYRIDSIEPTRIALTYLPRNAMQTIAIAQRAGGGAVMGTLPPARADLADADAVVRVSMPDKATVGEEIAVLVSLDPRKASLIERGSVELRYDPAVLNLVGRPAGAAGAAGTPDPGRVALELAGGFTGHTGPASTVRLRIVAATSAGATTAITLANPSATDGESRTVAVSVDGPNPRPLTILRPQK